MTESINWKILQIIPALGGWKAVHCQELANQRIAVSSRSIICWALVESTSDRVDQQTQVRGIEQGTKSLVVVEDLLLVPAATDADIDRNQYFLGYDDPAAHKESEYWLKQAGERLKLERAQRFGAKNGPEGAACTADR